MPTDREKILQAAQRFVDKKKYDRAIAEYQKIIQQDPHDARTLLKVGDLQSRMEAFGDAIATYDRVGQYYASQGFALKAIAVYKQIRELIQKHAPNESDRYGHIVPKLAEIYTQLGLTSDALAAYDEVATRFQRGGRDRDAIDVFRKMVELDSNNPLPHLRLAEACCRVQSLDEAIDSFWSATELLIRMNRRDDALKVLERILHFRQDPRYARVAAQLYLERGASQQDGMQALAKLQVCFQADSRDLDTLSLLGQAFTAIGQEAKSIEVYKEMGRIAREVGDTDLYGQVVQHLLAVAPNDEQVRALANIGPESAAPPPMEVEASVVSVADAELEMVEDSTESSEAPFALQRAAEEADDTFASEAPTAAGRPVMASAPDVVVVEEGVEVAEEISAVSESFDVGSHGRKAIVDAESFRKLKLYPKALETLQIALEVDPRSIDVRDKMREILSESGDHEGATGESITIAAIYLDQGHRSHAEAVLYSVLEHQPDHVVALQMLEEMEAGVPAADDTIAQDFGQPTLVDNYEYAEPNASSTTIEAAAPAAGGEYDPNAPLPSYDLEEVDAAQAMAGGDGSGLNLDAVDDPFGENPLPSFGLGGTDDLDDDVFEDAEEIEEIDAEPESEIPLPSFAESEPAPAQAAQAAPQDASAVEEVLEEAEFFAARGLLEDARMILEDQLERSPGHPLLLERLEEVQQQLGGAGEVEADVRTPMSEPAPEDRSFDIAASLDALDEFEEPAAPAGEERPAFATQAEEVDVDQVFAKFKEGVSREVSDGDSATHYDLGVAYKEMGLLPDAITEFEVAARDAGRECMCWAMVGMIYLEQEDLDKAAEAFIKGLHAEQKTIDQEMSLYYDLGNVYEMKGNAGEALYYFGLISRRDPGYRDVKERIAALSPTEKQPEQSSARPIGEEDEFDKVFDELFDTKSS